MGGRTECFSVQKENGIAADKPSTSRQTFLRIQFGIGDAGMNVGPARIRRRLQLRLPLDRPNGRRTHPTRLLRLSAVSGGAGRCVRTGA